MLKIIEIAFTGTPVTDSNARNKLSRFPANDTLTA